MKTLILATAILIGGTAMALTEKETALCSVAACAARGDLKALEGAYARAYGEGWTTRELKEVASQLYAYCGFPRALNALGVLRNVAPANERGADAYNPSRPDSGSLARGAANQTKLCGREVKGDFFEWCPAIDDYLKAHLFGDIFGRDALTWRTREMATVAALAAIGNVKPQLDAHMAIAQHNGVSADDIAAILAVATTEDDVSAFPAAAPNARYQQYFSGRCWLAALSKNEKTTGVPIHNVTFEPGCRNNWHSHTGGQILVCVGGEGWYQARGEKARKLLPGMVVEIPPNVEHWHGAGPKTWFAHLSIECHPETNKNTWLEPVTDADYDTATKE